MRHEDYIKEIKMQVLKEVAGRITPHPEEICGSGETGDGLPPGPPEVLRPTSLEQVVGQDAAVRSLLAKVARPSRST